MPGTQHHRGRGGAAIALLLAASPLWGETRQRVPRFEVDVEVVSLSLAVTDPRGHLVTDVSDQQVAVYEDGVPQQITVFARERWPITLAVLIDSSSSMRRKLRFAQAAALRLLRTLGPDDRALVAQFSQGLTVLQDFTSDQVALAAAVESIEADGNTALRTALYVALKELRAQRREGELGRQALVVLTDGEDTASAVSEDQALELARGAGVNVYAIGIQKPATSPVSSETVPRFFMTALARETGGRAFFPTALSDLNGLYEGIAEELRTLYGVAYVSNNARRDGAWRRITIRSLRPNLLLRHRTGYYAPRSSREARGE
jgi:Ca-activated chloride channel family protein